jgi:uncharacterized membrane protein
VVAVVALGVSAYLTWASFAAGGRVAGCGGSELGCGNVLASRWSQWLGLPVALPAAVVYAVVLISLLRIDAGNRRPASGDAWRMLLFLAPVLAGSALWFLGLQALVLNSACVYCLTAHCCGLLLSGFIVRYGPFRFRQTAPATAGVTVLLTGLAGTALLIAGQLLVAPRRPDMRVQRGLEMSALGITIDAARHPRLGPADAPYYLVMLFDYTCEHCRVTSGYLEQGRRRYGDQLAIVPLVVPYHADCNPYVETANPAHADSCTLARLALAVWRAKPAAFETYHFWLLASPRTAVAAREHAVALVGAAALDRVLSDPDLDRRIEEYVAIYGRSGGGQLPKLMHGTQTAQGEPPSAQHLFDFLESNVGLQPR